MLITEWLMKVLGLLLLLVLGLWFFMIFAAVACWYLAVYIGIPTLAIWAFGDLAGLW